jgi:tetratricopeptide (TPR) repeat protein
MLINKKNISEVSRTDLFSEGINYINTSQWLMAYTIFDKLYEESKDKSVSILYNTALCNFYAGKYKSSVLMLEEALRFLSFQIHQTRSDKPISQILLEDEFLNNHYQKALTESVINLNPNEVKLRIRRLLVDTHFQIGNWKEIIRLSTLPDMEKCENVRVASAKAKEQ